MYINKCLNFFIFFIFNKSEITNVCTCYEKDDFFLERTQKYRESSCFYSLLYYFIVPNIGLHLLREVCEGIRGAVYDRILYFVSLIRRFQKRYFLFSSFLFSFFFSLYYIIDNCLHIDQTICKTFDIL